MVSNKNNKNNKNNTPQLTETLLYKSPNGSVTLEVIIDQKNETLWGTKKTMAELFNVKKQTIDYHIQNIYDDEELSEVSTTKEIMVVQKEGNRNVKRNLDFYNLDIIIAVGYRVGSKEGTQFRKWSTSVLKEFMIKGFVLDDELLKNGTRFGKDYFDELLERIREIRALKNLRFFGPGKSLIFQGF
ncbi:MAG: virulence RhuM family protein [Methanobacteriaceae archaeon]